MKMPVHWVQRTISMDELIRRQALQEIMAEEKEAYLESKRQR
jgi:hypothetical protein